MVARLVIGTQDNTGVFANIPVPITYQISDIREPEKRKGSRSLTIKIPATQDTNILFENIFQVNIDLQTFDPRLKTSATYYIDELSQLVGYIQLLKILKDETTGKVEYELNLLGELKTFFTEVNGEYLDELDFSAYNHTLNYTNIVNSWSATAGSGYYYPMIDWGVNNSNLSQVRPEHLRGCLYAREIMEKMFDDKGYTWTSTFLDSTFFNNLIITPNELPALSTTVMNNNKFLAEADGSQLFTLNLNNPSAGSLLNYFVNTWNTLEFPSETYDTGNIFNNVSYVFTPTSTNNYNLNLNMALNFVWKRNGVDKTTSIGAARASGIHIAIVNTTTNTVLGIYDFNINSASFAVSNSNNCNVVINNINLTAGNTFEAQIKFFNIAATISNPADYGGTWTLEVENVTGSNFGAEFTTTAVYEGQTVFVNDLIPSNTLKTDFIRSIIRLFNLQVQLDKNNPNNYLIETWNDFYNQPVIDWTGKHDENSETQITPVGELNYKFYNYSYKEDGDYYNKKYKDEYKEVYGFDTNEITSDFVNGTNTTDVIFSPTPYAVNPSIPMVTPVIIKKENNTIAPIKPNTRILYRTGSINLPTGISWTFVYNSGANSVVYNTYPHAGHTDNPYAPTLDLNWGFPKKVYYTFPNQTWTTNNLFNKYYSRYLNEITDKDSKIITTNFYLSPLDIHTFDFRRPIFWKDAYYLVNKIINYNPLERNVTQVELLKLQSYDDFSPTVSEFNGGLGTENTSWERIINGNITNGNNTNYGNDSAVIGGSGNFISANTESVTLINSENVVTTSQDVNNFFGVGLEDDSDLFEDGANLYNSLKITQELGQLYYTSDIYQKSVRVDQAVRGSDFDVIKGKGYYTIDTSAGDVTATIDVDELSNYEFTFKIIDATHDFIIDTVNGTELVDGSAVPYNTGAIQNDAIKIKIVGTRIDLI
jgi:hypothetical protein